MCDGSKTKKEGEKFKHEKGKQKQKQKKWSGNKEPTRRGNRLKKDKIARVRDVRQWQV